MLHVNFDVERREGSGIYQLSTPSKRKKKYSVTESILYLMHNV